MYTLFHAASTNGSTVMRALAWEFPNEPGLANADRQFLLGPSLLITPVLEQGKTSVDGVFPGVGAGTIWYDWYTHAAVSDVTPGQNVTIDAPLGTIPLYVRGGSILPMQGAALTTYAARQNDWALLVALDGQGSATGSLYVDDGESLVPNSTLNVAFSAANNALSSSSTGTYQASQPLANVTILGVDTAPQSITLNGASLMGWNYNDTSRALQITGLAKSTNDGAWAQDWELRWS
jgi:alpha-glucosidase